MTEPLAISAGIAQLIMTVLAWGSLFAAAAVIVARRFGKRFVWYGWLGVAAVLTIIGVAAFHRTFPVSAGPIAGSVYMMSMFAGIPTAAIAFVATRMERRVPRRSWLAHFAFSLLAFLGSIPLALIIGAAPDFAGLW